ncbi:MAG TPA: TlpA disulfide reductase family protein [Bacteroidia bacterium]|nr:TlpA disulfide reductase family protein [Bacteroidia bacterium]
MKQFILAALGGLLLPLTAFSQQQVEVVKFDFVESLLKNNSDTTYVINFWATWCKPCVKEIPAFELLHSKYQDKNLKVILISLDFKRELEKRLIPFVKEKNMKSKIVLLDAPDYNSWIDKVDKSWGGAIPATLILNNKKNARQFYEKEFTFEELETHIKPLIH